jgi:hypothetical protein
MFCPLSINIKNIIAFKEWFFPFHG